MPTKDLLFLHGGIIPRCRSHVDKHFDGYHTLQFMSSGAVELLYEDKKFTLKGPWFWHAYPGPRIQFHPAPGHSSWAHRYIAFKGSMVAQWIADGLLKKEPQPAPKDKSFATHFDKLLKHSQRTDHWGNLRAINLLEGLLLELAERSAYQKPTHAWLEPVLEFLSDAGKQPADYAALAACHGIGLSTMRRLFKQTTGVPLHTYALQCRIAQARNLLGETDLPIKAIAEKLGYSDAYFFSRQFHQQTGIPPAAYRKSRQ